MAQTVKNSTCNAGGLGSIPGSGRSLGGGHGNSLQYSCLENPMDRGAWWPTIHGVAQSWTGLSDLHKNNAFLFYLSVPEGRGFIDSEPYSLSSSTIGPRPEEGNQSTYLGGEMKNEKEMNV